jgi:phosphoglycolate phosphatase
MPLEHHPRCLIFDLDGTLVDSVPDLTAALNRLMARHGLAAFSRPEVTAMVGDGAAVLVTRAFAARDTPLAPDAIDAFLADYTANAARETRPFPGVAEALADLRDAGWRMAVCTNKPVEPARVLLDALGIAGFFVALGGGDSFPVRKPDPAHLLATLAAAGGTPGRSVMVGDHHNDVAAARGAGVPCVFAGWGYGAAGMAEGAAVIAPRFADVPALADRLVPRSI